MRRLLIAFWLGVLFGMALVVYVRDYQHVDAAPRLELWEHPRKTVREAAP